MSSSVTRFIGFLRIVRNINSAVGILAEGRKPSGATPGGSRRSANNEIDAENSLVPSERGYYKQATKKKIARLVSATAATLAGCESHRPFRRAGSW